MSDIIGTVLAVAAHEAGKTAISFLRDRRRARSVWRVVDPDKLVVCLSADTPPQAETGVQLDPKILKLRPGAGAAHVHAAVITCLSLQIAYGKFSVEQVRLSADGVMHEDLVLLGNPDHNRATKDLLSRLRTRYPDLRLRNFARGGITWRHSSDGEEKRYEPLETESGLVEQDFGVAMRLSNPFAAGDRRTVVLLAGCTTFGTLAAVRVLTHTDKLVAAVIRAKQDFACLVSTRVRENSDELTDLKIEDYQPLFLAENVRV